MRKIALLLFAFASAATVLTAQITIAPNSTIEVSGTMTVNGSVRNASALTGFTAAQIVLSGANQTFHTTTPLSVHILTISGGGTKTLEGDWEVTSRLELENGIIVTGPNGRLTYTGNETVEGNAASYINGYFFHIGTGRLFFPVGTSTLYAPAFIPAAPHGEYGLRVVAGDPAFALPGGVSAYFAGHYWETTAPVNGPVSLSLNGLETFLSEGEPVVLQAQGPGSIATSLAGAVSAGFVSSEHAADQPVIGIGKTDEFNLVIRDMITPFVLDGINDKLTIENIDLTTANTVKFIDRWGVVVAEWENYSEQTEYDFGKLSPGNYVCIVEYTSPGSSKRGVAKGMVTILKGN